MDGAGTYRQKQAQEVLLGEGKLASQEGFDFYDVFFTPSTTMIHELLDREMKAVFIVGHKASYFTVYIYFLKNRVKSI